MEGIRVQSTVTEIPVNDNGDVITLNLSDHRFPGRLFALMDQVETINREMESKVAEIMAAHPEDSAERYHLLSDLDEKIHESVVEKVDGVFGEGACRKIFGDILPGMDLFCDFFDQIMPYVAKAVKKQEARLRKYSAARTGNV